MQSQSYKVSIIIPAFNCDKYIKSTIESVLTQTYNNWEAIIIDDCSTDNTYNIAKEQSNKNSQIRVYRLRKNSGAAAARNKAIELATGTFLAFLDSDDIWYPDKLETQIKFMIENDYLFTCTDYDKIDEEGNRTGTIIYSSRRSSYDKILRKCPGNSTVIYNADALGKFVVPDIRIRNDYVLWLQVIKKTGYLYGLNQILGSHRVRKNSLSYKKTSLVKYHWSIYKRIESLSTLYSVYLILHWIFVTVFRIRYFESKLKSFINNDQIYKKSY